TGRAMIDWESGLNRAAQSHRSEKRHESELDAEPEDDRDPHAIEEAQFAQGQCRKGQAAHSQGNRQRDAIDRRFGSLPQSIEEQLASAKRNESQSECKTEVNHWPAARGRRK